MKPKIEKLARSYMGDKFNNLSGTDKRWVELNFTRDYDMLYKVKLVNDIYEEIEKEDYRGLLRHVEDSAGMEGLAKAMYDYKTEYFEELFSEEVNAKIEHGNYDTIDSIVEARNFCVEEVEYALRQFRKLTNFYREMD